jgi:hypothetical protein
MPARNSGLDELVPHPTTTPKPMTLTQFEAEGDQHDGLF